jgi:hypothetical protein
MILDERLEFADAVALNTGAVGSYLIGDVIDLQVARDIGNGETAYVVIQIDTLPTSGGSATAAFSLCSDAQAAIAVDGSQTTHATTGAKTIAQMPAGTRFILPIPAEGSVYERYVGIVQTTGTAAFTAGKINAFITLDNPATWKSYADAQN